MITYWMSPHHLFNYLTHVKFQSSYISFNGLDLLGNKKCISFGNIYYSIWQKILQ